MWRTSVAPPASSSWTGISRGAISTTWVSQAELDQRVGRLQPEQPAADDDAAGRGPRWPRGSPRGPRWCGRRSSRPCSRPAHRRHERRGTGGQHERVVADRVDARRGWRAAPAWPGRRRDVGDGALDPVDRGDGGVEDEAHARVVVLPLGQQRQLVGALGGEEAGQRDPVVGGARLLAEDHDVVGLGEPALDGGLDEAVADHAVADDDESGSQVRHAVTVGTDVLSGVSSCFGEENPHSLPSQSSVTRTGAGRSRRTRATGSRSPPPRRTPPG